MLVGLTASQLQLVLDLVQYADWAEGPMRELQRTMTTALELVSP